MRLYKSHFLLVLVMCPDLSGVLLFVEVFLLFVIRVLLFPLLSFPDI